LPVNYSGESVLETSRIVHIVPFKRNVFITQHAPQTADLEEYKWLLKYANTELWYEKPHRSFFRQMKALEGISYELPDPLPLFDARPVSLETPRLCASRALTTPTDDDIYDCTSGHTVEGGYASTCHQCSEQKSEALEATDLVYYLVLTTYQASNPFIHGSHFNGRQIYKMIKCGSREAAAAEAFYTTGVNGWNVAFSCVTRLGEGFDDRNGTAEKMEELWMLATDEDNDDENSVRVFY
jgi:hypothetical protein